MDNLEDKKCYKTRLAPTPSGYLHVGHAFAFKLAHSRAKERGGKLILRLEDLDKTRCADVFYTEIINDLKWLSIDWTLGPPSDGDSIESIKTSLYCQSNRLHLYEAAWQSLYQHNLVYPCSHSRKAIKRRITEEVYGDSSSSLGGMRGHPRSDSISSVSSYSEESSFLNATNEGDAELIYPSSLRPCVTDIDPSLTTPPTHYSIDGEEKTPVCWRFRVPDHQKVRFYDNNLGEVIFTSGIDFGDFVIYTKAGYPSYELAVVVDDLSMGVTEVVRGRDLLLSTARQILLINALTGATSSVSEEGEEYISQNRLEYYHCELVRDKEGVRLSKRDNPRTQLKDLRESGISFEEAMQKMDDSLSSPSTIFHDDDNIDHAESSGVKDR
jgi:glutamyl-tRNA synthetase